MQASFLDGLNAEQLAAVTLPSQSALILAGAGSGKTRVLTTRMAWLIQSGQVSPHGLLAVTFTNKAAREMLTRLSSLLPINTRGMWVGTFHGLCNRLLRAHAAEARLPSLFQILDSQDQLGLVKRVMKSIGLDEDRYPPRQMQYFINRNKEEGRRPAEADSSEQAEHDIYLAYEIQCQKDGVVDFAELLLRSVELLRSNELIREHYRNRFRHVLVDEFQDTNRLQYAWLKLLVASDSAVFAVGDDDQSIYGFRGAEVANMRLFQKDYGLKDIIRLEQNYRSLGNILDAANALIRHNQGRMGKNLWTQAGSGEPLLVFEAESDADEARFMVEQAQSLRGEGVAFSDMAVLYRSNAQSRIMEHALFRAGIPYRVYGGQRFFERMEIKHALAYLRLAANSADDGAFLRVVNFPPRGIGARSLELLQERAQTLGGSLYDASGRVTLPGKAGTGLRAFLSCIGRLSEAAASGAALQDLVLAVLDMSGLVAHYRQEREGAERVENLEELVTAAAQFTHETELADLPAFLSHASLEAGEHEASAEVDALQLMTVHSAKGLEFHTVFVCGLEEGLFPHENAMSEEDGLEEERRLMYVAVTRARQRLYLTRAGQRMLHGQTRYGLRSRFVDEIPSTICRWLSATESRMKDGQHREFSGLEAWGKAPTRPAGHVSRVPFAIGQQVRHERFGLGMVMKWEGSGQDARIQVNFRDVGVKWLALSFAKLVPA